MQGSLVERMEILASRYLTEDSRMVYFRGGETARLAWDGRHLYEVNEGKRLPTPLSADLLTYLVMEEQAMLFVLQAGGEVQVTVRDDGTFDFACLRN